MSATVQGFKVRNCISGKALPISPLRFSTTPGGGYVRGRLDLALNERWGSFAGIGYEHWGRQSLPAGRKAATLKLDQTVSVLVGISRTW